MPFPLSYVLEAEALSQLFEITDKGIKEARLIGTLATGWACPMLVVKKKVSDNKRNLVFIWP